MRPPPVFDADFAHRLDALFAWRRDVRRFRPDPIGEDDLRACLAAAHRAPSVGNSRPWRFVRVADLARAGGRDRQLRPVQRGGGRGL